MHAVRAEVHWPALGGALHTQVSGRPATQFTYRNCNADCHTVREAAAEALAADPDTVLS